MSDERTLKVGDRIRVYAVASYTEPHGLTVISGHATVEGDEDGVPLCLSWKVSDKGGHFLGHYSSGTMHLHEAAYSEEEAVRRWRAAKLMSAVDYEQKAAELRRELRRPITVTDGTKKKADEILVNFPDPTTLEAARRPDASVDDDWSKVHISTSSEPPLDLAKRTPAEQGALDDVLKQTKR